MVLSHKVFDTHQTSLFPSLALCTGFERPCFFFASKKSLFFFPPPPPPPPFSLSNHSPFSYSCRKRNWIHKNKKSAISWSRVDCCRVRRTVTQTATSHYLLNLTLQHTVTNCHTLMITGWGLRNMRCGIIRVSPVLAHSPSYLNK